MKFYVAIHRESFYNSEDVDIKHYEIEAESLEEAEQKAQNMAIRIEVLSSTRVVSDVVVSAQKGDYVQNLV